MIRFDKITVGEWLVKRQNRFRLQGKVSNDSRLFIIYDCHPTLTILYESMSSTCMWLVTDTDNLFCGQCLNYRLK